MKGRTLWLVLAAGLLMRLALMPVTLHSDLLFIHYFPSMFSLHGAWDVYGHFGTLFLSQGFTYYPPLVYYLIGFSQWPIVRVDPGLALFLAHLNEVMRVQVGGAEPLAVFLAPFTRPETSRFLLWLKSPYLAADIVCLALAARALGGIRFAVKSWWLDPVLIFSTYAMGQYRVLSCAIVWLALVWVREGKRTRAFAALGALALMENYAFLIGPAVLLATAKDRRELLRLAVVATALFAAVFVPLYVSSDGYVRFAYVSSTIRAVALGSITNRFAGMTGPASKILFSVLLAALLGFLAAKRQVAAQLSDEQRFRAFASAAAVVLLLMYATSRISFHYVLWVLPPLAVERRYGAPWPRVLDAVFVVTLALFALDRRELNLGLLAPLDPVYFASFPSLHEAADAMFGCLPLPETVFRWLRWGAVVAAGRLIFSGLCLFFAWRLFALRLRPLLAPRARRIVEGSVAR